MSFHLQVMARRIPQELPEAWRQALSLRGLDIDFHPSFVGPSWSGGFLPIRVKAIAAGAFPAAARYSPPPFICGFELSVSVPKTRQARAGSEGRRYFGFRTPMGRSVADLRLQCFGAATLAIITDGLVADPQQGAVFRGERALANAAREADEYEARWAKERDWVFIPVPEHGGWTA